METECPDDESEPTLTFVEILVIVMFLVMAFLIATLIVYHFVYKRTVETRREQLNRDGLNLDAVVDDAVIDEQVNNSYAASPGLPVYETTHSYVDVELLQNEAKETIN